MQRLLIIRTRHSRPSRHCQCKLKLLPLQRRAHKLHHIAELLVHPKSALQKHTIRKPNAHQRIPVHIHSTLFLLLAHRFRLQLLRRFHRFGAHSLVALQLLGADAEEIGRQLEFARLRRQQHLDVAIQLQRDRFSRSQRVEQFGQLVDVVAAVHEKGVVVDGLLTKAGADEELVATLDAAHAIAEDAIGETDFAELWLVRLRHDVLDVLGEGVDALFGTIANVAVVDDQACG